MMGDANEGDPYLLLNRFQLQLHLLAKLLIQCAQRLIQQDDRRTVDQRASQGHALLLPARELRRVPIVFVRQLDHVQRRTRSESKVRSTDATHLEPKGDIVEHGHVGKQRVGLKDEVHRA